MDSSVQQSGDQRVFLRRDVWGEYGKKAKAFRLVHKESNYPSSTSDAIEEGNGYYRRWRRESLPRLLIVDDEGDLSGYLVNYLHGDYQIKAVCNGEQTLIALETFQPDIVLLDVVLSEVDKLEVCRLIKNNLETAATKVLLLTARADQAAKLEALRLGVDDFLTKPFSSVELKARLANLYQSILLKKELATLGKMSAGLLHEINNPLNYSLTALQLAVKDPAIRNDEGLFDICNDAIEGMERIAGIVANLKGCIYPSVMAKPKRFSFIDILDKALRAMANELSSIHVDTTHCTDALVIGSEGHIVQVMINLFSNARAAINNATRSGQGKISIHSAIHSGRLYVTVSDNGTGMDASVVKNIFDPFFTTKGIGDGMGMGLSICYAIIKSHGGDITVTTRPDEGAAFTFDLAISEDIENRTAMPVAK